MNEEYSRPLALAANLAGADGAAIEHLFAGRRVLIRVEETRASGVMRETLLLAVNETLRFCANVTVALPRSARELASAVHRIGSDIHDDSHAVAVTSIDETNTKEYDAVLNIGRVVNKHPAWVAVDASGWCARVATSAGDRADLPAVTVGANIYAALGAACLGVGQVFLALVDRPLLADPLELSLYDLITGAPGTLPPGPVLPNCVLDALLVGCGGVANGFAYASARAPLTGHLEAVDKQSLGPENMGAYVCATRCRIGLGKAEMIRQVLAPAIEVRPRPERFLFFRARVGYGQTTVPEIVIAGLDDERIRHDVQRLWAETTIDLAAEELTAQVIVKQLDDDGICLIGAYRVATGSPDELDELAEALGLPRERVADFESEITEADIAAAPREKRATLEAAQRSGQRVCGRATALDLGEEEPGVAFTPAVPFVTAFAGVVGAAVTTRKLIGEEEGSLHFQFSFMSYRGRKIRMRCLLSCECQSRRRAAA